MKRFKIALLAFTLVNFVFLSSANAEGIYWSNTKNGPTTIEEAKQQFGSRTLDPIEGVWFEEKLGSISIVKNKKQFRLYLIQSSDEPSSIFNGTWEATLIPTGSSSFNFFGRIWYFNKQGGINKYGTQGGTIELNSSANQFIKTYDRLSDAGINMNSLSRKVWPVSVDTKSNKSSKPAFVKEKKVAVKKNINKISKQNSLLQYWWVVVLVGLIAFFIYTQTIKSMPKKRTKKTSAKKSNPSSNFLLKFYRGEESLGISYWLYYAVAVGILSVSIDVMEKAKVGDITLGLFSIFTIAYFIFAMIGTWRSANSYTSMKIAAKQTYGWATLTKVLLVLAVIRSLVEVFNLFQ